MTLKLNEDFFIFIEVREEIKYIKEPFVNPTDKQNGVEVIGIDKQSSIKLILKKKTIKKFIKKVIVTRKNNFVVSANDFASFSELLDCFVNNKLNVNKKYAFVLEDFGGFRGEITQKDDEKYLLISIISKREEGKFFIKEEIYLDKYNCKIILNNLRDITSKCIREEFVDTQLKRI